MSEYYHASDAYEFYQRYRKVLAFGTVRFWGEVIMRIRNGELYG